MVESSSGKEDKPRDSGRRFALLNLLSNPALDGPFVAGSWWLLCAVSFGGPVNWLILLSLFPAVWAIYLFDRLYDAAKHTESPPPRKEFARQNPRLLQCLLIATTLWACGVALFLPKEIWIQAAIIGFITLGYFLIYRWKMQSGRIPFKEVLIGFCFAAGTGLPYAIPVDWVKFGALGVFGVLCTVNCLIISRAEADYDKNADQSAWFSVKGRSFPFFRVFALCFILPPLLAIYGLPVAPTVCLIVANLLLCMVYARGGEDSIQPLSDAALWIPGICGSVVEILR